MGAACRPRPPARLEHRNSPGQGQDVMCSCCLSLLHTNRVIGMGYAWTNNQSFCDDINYRDKKKDWLNTNPPPRTAQVVETVSFGLTGASL